MGRPLGRLVVTAAAAAACFAGLAGPATAAPAEKNKLVTTVACPDGAGGFEAFDVIAVGAVGFVIDDVRGASDKVFVRSIDLAVFSDEGVLVDEFHKTYGKRTGHGAAVSCSGSFQLPGATAFFDVLITRPLR